MLFINNKGLTKITENQNIKESTVQKLVESNLDEILSTKFIKSEVKIGQYRLDTLGYKPSQNSLVIVEYKKSISKGVIEQAIAYLSLVNSHKSQFINYLNNSQFGSFQHKDIKWDKTKLIVVTNGINNYQKTILDNSNQNLEIWEFKFYENNLFEIKETKKYSTFKNPNILKPLEYKTTINDYSVVQKSEIWSIFLELHNKILELKPNIVLKFNKTQINYCSNSTVFFSIKILKNQCNIKFSKKTLKNLYDPTKKIYKNGTFIFKSKDNFNFLLFLIKQPLKQIKSNFQ